MYASQIVLIAFECLSLFLEVKTSHFYFLNSLHMTTLSSGLCLRGWEENQHMFFFISDPFFSLFLAD